MAIIDGTIVIAENPYFGGCDARLANGGWRVIAEEPEANLFDALYPGDQP